MPSYFPKEELSFVHFHLKKEQSQSLVLLPIVNNIDHCFPPSHAEHRHLFHFHKIVRNGSANNHVIIGTIFYQFRVEATPNVKGLDEALLWIWLIF